MHVLKFIMCLMLSVLTAVPGLLAQVRLHGTVTNEQGEPMDIVHIRLLRGSIGTLTDFKGEYELIVPDSDTLRVIFTSLGYRRTEKVVNTRQVKADTEGRRRLLLNVQMRPNQSVLNDVEVTAQRQTSPTGMEHLQVQDVRNMRSTSGNAVEDMIGTMAGVNMNNELSSQYNVRGGSFDENLVYVNGIEVFRPQLIASGQQEGLSFINPSMVGAVDFSTGGFSAEYGDKMSSVLDITYRRPDSLDYDATLSITGASASLGQRHGDFTQLHGLRFKRNATILNSLETKGEYDPIFFDYQTYLTWAFGRDKKWDLSFLGNVAVNDYRFTPHDRETTFGTSEEHHSFKVYFDGHEKDQFDTYFGALTLGYRGFKGTQLELRASAFMTDEEVTYDISGEYWMDQASSVSQSGLGVGRYMQHARNYLQASVMALGLKGISQVGQHRLTYGLTLQSEHISDKIAEWERRDSVGYSLPREDSKLRVVENLHSAYRGTTSRFSLFAQDSYGWDGPADGRFLLQGGIRLSHWSFNGEWLLSPRASLRYTYGPERNKQARLSAGIYYQSPFYKEYRLAYIDADGNRMVEMNSDIRSQRSWQLIMGWDNTFRANDRPFKFTVEAYYKGISDYIPYTVENVQIRYLGANIGKAYVMGIDAKLFGQFVEGTDSWLSFSLMKSPETYDIEYRGQTLFGLTTPRPTEQRYGVGLFFSDYYPGHDDWRVFLRGVFNDGLPFYSPEGGRGSGIFRTPAYKRIDLGATHVWDAQHYPFMRRGHWRHIREIQAGLDFFNLLDIDNTNSYYWVTVIGDDGSTQGNPTYAVPNYLTGRMINLSIGVRF